MIRLENEEIVKEIQKDPKNRELLNLLFAQNAGLIHKIARNYKLPGLEHDDLMQEGYFCVLASSRAFRGDLGYKYTTYLVNALKWRYNRLRRSGAYRETSIDKELSEGDDISLHDVLPDPAVNVEGEALEDFARTEAGRSLLKAIETLPERQQRVLLCRYRDNMTLEEISAAEGLKNQSAARSECMKALQTLSRRPALQHLRNYISETAEVIAYRPIGAGAYLRHNLSSTEKAAFKDMGINPY